MSAESLLFKSALDDSQFQAGLRRMHIGAQQVSGLIGKAVGALGFGLAIGGIEEGTRNVMNFARHLGNLTIETGLSSQALLSLKQAARGTDVDLDAIAHAVNKMQEHVAGGGSAFRTLGLDIEDLKKMSPEEQFRKIGKAIEGMDNAATRAKAARDIFGRAGIQLLPVFASDAFKNESGGLSASNQMLADHQKLLADTANSLNALGNSSKSFFVGLAVGVAPELKKTLDDIGKLDFSAMGKSIGDALGNALATSKEILGNLNSVVNIKGAVESVAPSGLLQTAKDIMPLNQIKTATKFLKDAVLDLKDATHVPDFPPEGQPGGRPGGTGTQGDLSWNRHIGARTMANINHLLGRADQVIEIQRAREPWKPNVVDTGRFETPGKMSTPYGRIESGGASGTETPESRRIAREMQRRNEFEESKRHGGAGGETEQQEYERAHHTIRSRGNRFRQVEEAMDKKKVFLDEQSIKDLTDSILKSTKKFTVK